MFSKDFDFLAILGRAESVICDVIKLHVKKEGWEEKKEKRDVFMTSHMALSAVPLFYILQG